MKTVAMLASLGILSLFVFSCRGSASAPEHAPAPAPAPVVWVIEQEAEENLVAGDSARVLLKGEKQELIRKQQLPPVYAENEVVEYNLYSRAGVLKHYKIKKTAPAPVTAPTRID